MFAAASSNIRGRKLTDSAGHTADFSNVMVVLTANLYERVPQTGFLTPASYPDIRKILSKHFPSELLNRIDYVIPFKELDSRENAPLPKANKGICGPDGTKRH